jgi:hypothetical protein
MGYTNILLTANTRMSRNEVFYSPNGQFSAFLTLDNGDLVLVDNTNNEVVWRANAGGGAQTCNMQPDGNMLLRRSDGSVTWSTHTSGNPGASLRLDDGGQLSLMVEDGTPLWMAGIPRGQYNNSTPTTHTSLAFPIRGAFYYPWFPETWSVNGSPVQYAPRLGYYSNGQSSTAEAHVDMLEYAHVDLAIASWWGPDSHLDRSRITNLLNKSRGKSLQWTIYHEVERDLDPTVAEIQADLAYLKKWFAWHENWAHIDGLPVVFLYNEKDDCEISDRWMTAAQGEWFVVLKLFSDHENCSVQPSQWHQYGPASAVVHQPGYSFSISPGFWRADQAEPLLARVSNEDFYTSVVSMVNSNEPWQLITTFNEWGEGTAVEPAAEWASPSGYGYYLDSLHNVF